MATKNSINNISSPIASTAVTVDPGAAGDSYIQLNINTGAEFRFGVDDTDDSFRIAQGSALGTTDTFVMSDAGERTMPLQPAFLAYLPSDDNNRTGAGGAYIIGTNVALTEVYDQNSDFNTNGTFTAPQIGRYLLYGSVKVDGITAAMVSGASLFITSNRHYWAGWRDAGAMRTPADAGSWFIETIADMDAADTATFNILLGGDADTVDILGQATDPITYFCGYLIV